MNLSGSLLATWGHAAPWQARAEAAQLGCRQALAAPVKGNAGQARSYAGDAVRMLHVHRLNTIAAFCQAAQVPLDKPCRRTVGGLTAGCLARVAPALGVGQAMIALTSVSALQLALPLGPVVFGTGRQEFRPYGLVGALTEQPLATYAAQQSLAAPVVSCASLAAACLCRLALQAARLPLAVAILVNALLWGLGGALVHQVHAAATLARCAAQSFYDATHGQRPALRLVSVEREKHASCSSVAQYSVARAKRSSERLDAMLRQAERELGFQAEISAQAARCFDHELRRVIGLQHHSSAMPWGDLAAGLGQTYPWLKGPEAKVAWTQGGLVWLRL